MLYILLHEILTTTKGGIIIPISLVKELSLRDVQCAAGRALLVRGGVRSTQGSLMDHTTFPFTIRGGKC